MPDVQCRRGSPTESRILAAAIAIAWTAAPAPATADTAAGQPAATETAPSPDGDERRSRAPSFLRDTAITLRVRTYYLDVQTVTPVEREAWAAGGWLAYRSGWALDTLQVGATVYGSAPVYAPRDQGETLLLAPGRKGYLVVGEAFAALRLGDRAELRGYRQLVQQPYVDGQDNAMTPNTFEGVTLGGRLGAMDWFAGYLARIKLRNADRFVPMAEAAGARGREGGVGLASVLLPAGGVTLELAAQYGVDTFSTLFARAEHAHAAGHGVRLQLGAQLTDQRAVGEALAARTRVRHWSTQSGTARVALTYRALTLKLGGSATGTGNRIQSPWGFYPGYLRLTQELFNRAGERAWLAGVACDLSTILLPGLSAWSDVARGVGAVDPLTRAHLPDQTEYDLVVTYRPPAVAGLRLRVRGAVVQQEGAPRTSYQVRVIANWELPLLRAPVTGQRGPGGRDGRRPMRPARSAKRGSVRSGARSGSTLSQASRPRRSRYACSRASKARSRSPRPAYAQIRPNCA